MFRAATLTFLKTTSARKTGLAAKASASSVSTSNAFRGASSKFTRPLTTTVLRSFSSASNEGRPFKVLGIQQIAIGCETRDPLNAIWKDIFGLQAHTTKTIESENVVEDIVKLGPAPYEVEIDLMCPVDPTKSPKVHVPPLNHVGLWIDDLEKAVEWMTAKGVRFTPGGIRPGAAGHNVTFIHPKGNADSPISGAGVLLELVQAPPEVIKAFTSAK
jgi:lactoylglutathione lyase